MHNKMHHAIPRTQENEQHARLPHLLKVTPRLLDGLMALPNHNLEIPTLLILEPTRALVQRELPQIRVRQLLKPPLLTTRIIRPGPCLPDHKRQVVRFREGVVEVGVDGGEGGAGGGVGVQADDVDVLGTGEPGFEAGGAGLVGGPVHLDFRVGGASGVDALPGGDEVGLGWGVAIGLGPKGVVSL